LVSLNFAKLVEFPLSVQKRFTVKRLGISLWHAKRFTVKSGRLAAATLAKVCEFGQQDKT
jgi:hypothetical protein